MLKHNINDGINGMRPAEVFPHVYFSHIHTSLRNCSTEVLLCKASQGVEYILYSVHCHDLDKAYSLKCQSLLQSVSRFRAKNIVMVNYTHHFFVLCSFVQPNQKMNSRWSTEEQLLAVQGEIYDLCLSIYVCSTIKHAVMYKLS